MTSVIPGRRAHAPRNRKTAGCESVGDNRLIIIPNGTRNANAILLNIHSRKFRTRSRNGVLPHTFSRCAKTTTGDAK
jgi:hypothetical protein